MSIYKSFSGFCPLTKENESVKIEYIEVPILGCTSPGYKAMRYTCEHLEQCSEQRCPIFLMHTSMG